MKFKYDFLDKNAYLAIDEIRKKHKNLYELVFMIVTLMNLIRDDDESMKYIDNRHIYIIATLYDCYTTFSSEILLLERGLSFDYYILLRSFYEKKFKLFAVIKNKRNFKYAIEENTYNSTKLAHAIMQNEHNTFDDLKDKVEKEKYDFSILEKKEKSVESWANNAGLIGEYDKQYAFLSSKTHYDLGSLASKFNKDKNDNLIYSTFSYVDFNENIIIACDEMLSCIVEFLAFIKNDSYNEQIKKINDKLDLLSK